MLLGRRRRYFGYPKDLSRNIDTPESAKSYASYASSLPSLTSGRIQCMKGEISPDPTLPKRYADRALYTAIATQVPHLLPPLKNTFQFTEIDDRPINFHNPHLEHHFERSLYYIWLSKNDRQELCRIVDAHLGSRGRGHKPHGTKAEYREIGNPIQRPAPVDYSSMPRNLSVLDDISPRSLKSKFQKGIWDPPKTPRDRFVQDHGKSPAMDSICYAYPGNQKTRVNENDIQDCLLAARKLLGPYTGIGPSMGSYEDIPDEIADLIAENNRIQKDEENKKKQLGFAKRPFGYNSSQIKYEKQISSAVDYYNKIKSGARNPTPPAEIFGSLKQYEYKTVSKTLAKIIQQQEKEKRQSVKAGTPANVTTKRKFNKANITEDDYMDMYLHHLGSEVDISVKKPIRSLTDITKLKKKLHIVAEANEDEDIDELVRNDSFSDIQDKTVKRLLKGEINPLQQKGDMTDEDAIIVDEILGSHYDKLKNPKMREIFTRFTKVSMDVPSSTNTLVSTPPLSADQVEFMEQQLEDDEKFERTFGASYKEVEEIWSEMQVPSTQNDSVMDASLVSSTESDSSSQNAASIEIPTGQVCNILDIECLSKEGALGPRPFGRSNKPRKISGPHGPSHDPDEDEPENNIFAKEHWKRDSGNKTRKSNSLKK